MEFSVETIEGFGRGSSASIRSKTIRIRIPRRLRREKAAEIRSKFLGWAMRKLEKIDPAQLEPEQRTISFSNGQEILLMGTKLRVSLLVSGGRAYGRIGGGELRLNIPATLPEEMRPKTLHELARKAISLSFHDEVYSLAQEINNNYFHVEFSGISFKDQKTRWGSCSRKTKRISINFRLLFAPPSVLRYVIAHELAHVRHPNHSQRFWEFLSKAVPDHKIQRAWLRKNGHSLGSVATNQVSAGQAMLPNNQAGPDAGSCV